MELPWREVDLSTAAERSRPAQLDEIVAQEASHRFDMKQPPLLRLALVRLGHERHTLILTIHHILVDGWSISMLMRELFGLYDTAGDSSGMPDPAPYKTYLAWLSGQDRAESRAVWANALSGLEEPCRLTPGESRRTLVTTPEQIVRSLPAEISGLLQE
nr:condensation domain-containing protein [Streptomyces sp. DSM 41633]